MTEGLHGVDQASLQQVADDKGLHLVKVTWVHHWTQGLFSFRVERPSSFRFRSGEFIMIGLLGENSRPLLRALGAQGHFALGRLRCNQRVYFTPSPRSPRQRRPRVFGPSGRVDQLLTRFPHRVRQQPTGLWVRGRERIVHVWDAEVLLRRVWPHRALPARVVIVTVPGLQLAPWYLLCTDLTLDPVEAVHTYAGRFQIEVNFDEVKELGLGHYQGRSGQGVRRWPLFLCVAHVLLKFLATGVLSVPLPALSWAWYPRENTVGQVRRRLIELCRPRISREKPCTVSEQEFAKAA